MGANTTPCCASVQAGRPLHPEMMLAMLGDFG
jgi:hypothetical protein